MEDLSNTELQVLEIDGITLNMYFFLYPLKISHLKKKLKVSYRAGLFMGIVSKLETVKVLGIKYRKYNMIDFNKLY